MRKKNKLIFIIFIILIFNLNTINYYILNNKQTKVIFLTQIYENTPTNKPIIVMSSSNIDNFTSRGGKEFITYTKTQIEQLVQNSPNEYLFYKTLKVTMFPGFAYIRTESYGAIFQSNTMYHILQGGSEYIGFNLFGRWVLDNIGMFSVAF